MSKEETHTFEVGTHVLVPQHKLLNEEETERVLCTFNVKKTQIPKISLKDKAIAHLGAKPGDLVHILRKSPICGVSDFYRVVVE